MYFGNNINQVISSVEVIFPYHFSLSSKPFLTPLVFLYCLWNGLMVFYHYYRVCCINPGSPTFIQGVRFKICSKCQGPKPEVN